MGFVEGEDFGRCLWLHRLIGHGLDRVRSRLRQFILKNSGQQGRDFLGVLLQCFDSRCVEHKRSEEHTSGLQSLMRISYAVFCLKKKNKRKYTQTKQHHYTDEQSML